MCRWLTALGVALLLAPPALADSPRRTHDITVDDYFTQADVFQCKTSPDGKHVAYVEGRWQKATDDRKTDLWVVDTKTRAVRRLTDERGNDRAPVWSPDGRHVYFLGSRKRDGEKQPPYNGKPQVWRVGLQGGPSQAVTRAEEGVQLFDLSPDGRTVYYVTEVEKIDGEWKHLRQQFRDIEVGYGADQFSQVWKLDLESWRADKILEEHRVIREMQVSPDGSRLGLITTPDSTVVSFEGRSRVDVHDLKGRKTTPLPDRAYRADAPSPYGWLENLAWSPDGQALAWNVIFDAYPAEVIVAEWKGGEPAVFKMPRPPGVSLQGYGSPLAWREPGALGFLGEEKARVRLYCTRELSAGRRPDYQVWTPGDVVVSSFSFNKDGSQAALVMNDPGHFPEVCLAGESRPPVPLTHLNPQADTWKLPKMSVVSWKGARGDPVEGVLELPPDYKPGQRVPLVLEIHGGPTTATHYQLQYWIYGRTLLPARGYAVLCPNYRGSTGYGDKFLTDLVGHENELDVEDILKGVDALVERGIADPERLAVSGWSNGGYLTNCLISKTTRFKAAISGAGIVDAVTEFGINDEPAYSMVFKQGFPWSNPRQFQRASPSYSLDKVRTPTLIHVGARDERCPPGQSRMLYRCLREYAHVPTELLVYPGEPHGLMKYSHRRAKMEWDLAWLERYVLGKTAK
jgi:dipeptidyl aminopeptidase/acylaminoacyl peptidase